MKTNIERLNELINPETFAFERGADYGKGKPASSLEITTHKMTDTLDKMVRALPPMGFAAGGGAMMGAYLGEDSIAKSKKYDHDILTRRIAGFGLDDHLEKIIHNFVSALNDLDPKDCKIALDKVNSLVKCK